jgi:uncharacterized protein YerC
MKVRAKNLSDKQRIETLDALYTTAGSLKGRAVMKSFLRDLLTESERVMLGRRILIARRLIAGNGYDTIQADMKVAPNTIRRVEQWLEDQIPGYEDAIRNYELELEKRKKKATAPKYGTFAYLKKKYPLHFLFFPSSFEK